MGLKSSRQHMHDADPDCEVCEGEGEYEVMHPGSDGEPHYYMQACECTVR